MDITTVIAWIGAITGTTSLFWDIYKWHQDKRPRLKINVETDAHLTLDNRVTTMTIHAANPTDKQITIQTIEFEVERFGRIPAPLGSNMGSIPPHEKREATVVVEQLRKELGVARLGRFILIDALGNKHKSESVWL